MKRRIVALAAFLVLTLSGCGSWMDGSYVSVKPHLEQNRQEAQQSISASSYLELRRALSELVESGTEQAVISVADMEKESLQSNIDLAVRYVTQNHPVGAYAVDEINCEIGTSSGQPAVAVVISYLHGRSEILRIKQTQNMDEAMTVIAATLDGHDAGVILRIERYQETDFAQLVSDYAADNPDAVMETPQVTALIYPESGTDRVVELMFTYQTSRQTLRSMQSNVQPVFQSAELYVRGEASESEKYSQLYSFLMTRYDYHIKTSITPAYSLLRHGVGDSKAFATVYAAMCRRAGLNCQVVSGTKDGEARFWNIVGIDQVYYHVDLLASSDAGSMIKCSDEEMSGYVWDYSAHPACGLPPEETEPTE